MSFSTWHQSVGRVALLAAAWIGPLPLAAQGLSGGRIKDFKLPDFYEATPAAPGATNRLKTLITGREAVPRPGGQYLVELVRIENYALEGRTNMVTEAPECLVNYPHREASSAGTLRLQSGDGQFLTEGLGFLCRMTNYYLRISNEVRTVVQQVSGDRLAGLALGGSRNAAPAKTNAPAVEAPITIQSERLEFSRETNRVVYEGSVQVDNPQLRLYCHRLHLLLDTNDTIREIIAEQAVHITSKTDGSRATADRAVYHAAPERAWLELLGHARWEDGPRSGRAERMVFDAASNTLLAHRQAAMRLPRTAVNPWDAGPGHTGAVTNPPPVAAGGSNQWVEVQSEWLVFYLPTTNRPHRLVQAHTNVVILSPADDSRATGDEATYDEASGTLTLAGNARWRDPDREMRAQRLEYDRTNNVFRAEHDAYVKLRSASLGRPQSLGATPTGATPSPALTNQFLEVNCREFEYRDEWLTFRQTVKGRLLESNTVLGTLECELARLKFRSNQLERVEVRHQVKANQLPLGESGQPRVARQLTCERLEADLSPTGYFRHVEARTNVLARQDQWGPGDLLPVRTTFEADRVTADFLPNTNAVDVARADGQVEARHQDKIARGDHALYTATNDLLVLEGDAELALAGGGTVHGPAFRLRPFQRWLREGGFGPFGLPMLPPPQSNAAAPGKTGQP